MRKITGSCHCSNVQYDLRWPRSTDVIATRECGCSFCKKHRGAWTSNTAATLHASILMPEKVTEYQFGTKTAIFYICKLCGVVPFVTSTINERLYAVINTNTFDNRADFEFSVSASDFENEETKDRLARREKNWINQVEILFANR